MAEKPIKTRNYGTIIYPESCEDWKERIENLRVPAFAVLHDRDVDEDGVIKKAHVHLFIQFDNTKPISKAKELFEDVNGVGCEVINSPKAYLLYMLHQSTDDPCKAKYSLENDLLCFGGAEPHSILKSADSKYNTISDILAYCEHEKVYSFSDLMIYCRKNNSEWFRCLCDNSIAVREFIRSLYWSAKTLNPCQEEYSLLDRTE